MYFANYTFVPDEIATRIAEELKTIEGISCLLGTSQKAGCKDIHMTNREATKEHSVAELLSRIEVDSGKIYGFGDASNDTYLFNAVQVKVAMGNAIPELKEMADEIIAPVSEDGLAQYFEHLI